MSSEKGLQAILDGSKEKQRKFLETVELQIGLKAWGPYIFFRLFYDMFTTFLHFFVYDFSRLL